MTEPLQPVNPLTCPHDRLRIARGDEILCALCASSASDIIVALRMQANFTRNALSARDASLSAALSFYADDDRLAQAFHATYEELAPRFGCETGAETRKPWADVPESNKRLMRATAMNVGKLARSVLADTRTPSSDLDTALAALASVRRIAADLHGLVEKLFALAPPP